MAEIGMEKTTTVTAEKGGGGESGKEGSDQTSPSTKKLKKVVKQFKDKVGNYPVPDLIRILWLFIATKLEIARTTTMLLELCHNLTWKMVE